MPLRIFALLGLALAACASNSSVGPTLCKPPVCYPAVGALAYEITPPVSSDQASTSSATVELDPSGIGFTVQLERAVAVSGVVSVGGTPGLKGGGTVVVSLPSRVPGRPAFTFQSEVDASTGAYALKMPPTHAGETATLHLLPRDQSYLPPESRTLVATTDTSVDVALPASDKLRLVAGQILDVTQKPVPDMLVRAVDPDSNDVLSTTVTTASDGYFVLYLASSYKGTLAELSATPTTASAPGTPTLQRALPTTGSGPLTVTMGVPAAPTPQNFTYRVLGLSSSGAELPVAAAQVEFVATFASNDGVTATFTQTTQTDADGMISLDLIPADAVSGSRTYQVTVSPPATSEFQARSLPIVVGPTGGVGAALRLDMRPSVTGRVIDYATTPVKNARVQPLPSIGTSLLTPVTLANQPKLPTSTTLPDGSFAMRLDGGTYDFGLIPAPLSALPRLWTGQMTIGGDVALGDLVVPAGVMVQVGVVDADGKPMTGASIQLYIVPQHSACPPGDAHCSSLPHLVADTSTAAGTAPVVLPAQ